MCAKDNQPFLMTQNTITEIFKYVIGFCALKCGDAINIAISVDAPESLVRVQGSRYTYSRDLITCILAYSCKEKDLQSYS